MADAAVESNQFTAFWNNVLVAKFERFRNVLLDGLSYHTARCRSRSSICSEARRCWT